MKIGLIDVDGHNFPNLPLMKLSAWHKQQRDSVEWYSQMFSEHMDRVYMSKVFSFSPDYDGCIDADEIIRCGSGYCIDLVDGREVYHRERDRELPPKIETIYPDYSLYPDLTSDTAYGFLSRGCPRDCPFCHVGAKEGKRTIKTADLETFWQGQRNISLMDPNLLACRESEGLLHQLIDSGAWVDFTQGLDIRLITGDKADLIRQIKVKQIHFAWDNYEDGGSIVPRLREFAKVTGWDRRKMGVYVLTNYNTTFPQDLERVYTLRELGFNPFIMIYDKQHVPRGHELRRLQRWVNSRVAFAAVKRFEEFN